MPCYQTSNLPAGFVTTGRTVHRTAAECNQACGEGACCEGTSCSVKPACRCQGAGKTFRGVGTTCDSLKGACCEGTSCSVKTSCECQGAGKVFRGVGTTCSPDPCASIDCSKNPSKCYCYCTSGGGTIPEYVNITINANWTGVAGSSCTSNVSKTVTLTRDKNQQSDSIGFAGYTLCFEYTFPFSVANDGIGVSVQSMKTSNGYEALVIQWQSINKACPDGGNPGNAGAIYNGNHINFQPLDLSGRGVCFARHSGVTFSETIKYGPGSIFPLVASVAVSGKINGFS